jgi:hypothetical protein
VASHLRNKDATLEYGSRLQSSGGRILLQSLPGVVQEEWQCFLNVRLSAGLDDEVLFLLQELSFTGRDW